MTQIVSISSFPGRVTRVGDGGSPDAIGCEEEQPPGDSLSRLYKSGESYKLLEQSIQRILTSGRITAVDRSCLLRAALIDAPMLPHQADLIRRIFDRLQMGLLKIVD